VLWFSLETFVRRLYGLVRPFFYVSVEDNLALAYCLVVPLRRFFCKEGDYDTFLFYGQKESKPICYIPTKV
jgi:hypothetical protein